MTVRESFLNGDAAPPTGGVGVEHGLLDRPGRGRCRAVAGGHWMAGSVGLARTSRTGGGAVWR